MVVVVQAVVHKKDGRFQLVGKVVVIFLVECIHDRVQGGKFIINGNVVEDGMVEVMSDDVPHRVGGVKVKLCRLVSGQLYFVDVVGYQHILGYGIAEFSLKCGELCRGKIHVLSYAGVQICFGKGCKCGIGK